MSGYLLWVFLTVAWNAANSVNSRSKNSSSRLYNFSSTLLVSALYIASIAYVANLLVEAHKSGRSDLFLLTIGVYAISSAVGSVLGQRVAICFEKSHHIER